MRISLPAALASTALTIAGSGSARADEPMALLLPPAAALDVVAPPARSTAGTGAPRVRFAASAGNVPPPPTFIPTRIHIPDLYNVDFERDPLRFAEPVDGDRYFAFEFVKPTARRPRVAVTYDRESLPIGEGSNRVSLELKVRF
jgi:hypothetical protein